MPEFFDGAIQKALHERKEKDALTNNRFIEMQPDMLSLIVNSNHISKGKLQSSLRHRVACRGKALSLLNVNESRDAGKKDRAAAREF